MIISDEQIQQFRIALESVDTDLEETLSDDDIYSILLATTIEVSE